jgi:hypothetical protein
LTYGRKEHNPPEEEGLRWDISGRQETFAGAAALKEAIEINSDHLNVKIHKVKGQFVIKTREKPPELKPQKTQSKSKKKKKKRARRYTSE